MTPDRFCVRCGQGFATPAEASLCPQCAAATGAAPIARTVLAPGSRDFPEASLVPAEWREDDVLLGLYEVKGLLGVGGMASVYRVWHRGWGMQLAVKSPLPTTLARGGGEAFAAEAGTWVGLGLHPHVVTCFYVRSLGGIPRVFAELVEGGSLRDWIVGTRRLYAGSAADVLARLLDVAIQFAWGLGYAHEQGLVHQDVKPANLLLTPDGVAKVTDFGLASSRVLELLPAAGGAADVSTVVRGVGGTPAYFSPEQAEAVAQAKAGVPAGERTWLTRRTDVWSWAVSVLEMFAGERRSEFGQVAAVELESYLAEGPAAGIPAMPAALASLLGECLRADPDARPHDFGEIADRLVDIYQDSTGTPYPRRRPDSVDLRADALNNRALSLLDLGRRAEAEASLEQALAIEPHHLEATYNSALVQWRDARISDVDVLQRVHAAGAWHDPASTGHLLGLVHLERRDPEAAVRALEAVPESADATSVAAALLAQARRRRAALAVPTGVLGRHDGAVVSVAVTPDGTRAISADHDGALRVWRPTTGECLRTMRSPGGALTSVALTEDGRFALSGGGDALLRLWDLDDGRCRTLAGHEWEATAVALSRDGARAVSGSWDGKLLTWDIGAARTTGTLEGHEDRITSVALSADGGVAVSGGGHDDETARSWDLGTGRCLHVLTEPNRTVEDVAVTADGRVAAAGSEDTSLWIWETATGRILALMPHPAYVWTVDLTPDARFVASGTEDGVVRWWELPEDTADDRGNEDEDEDEEYGSGRCLRTMDAEGSEYLELALAPAAGVLLAGGEDGVVHMWGLEPGPSIRSEYAYCLPRATAAIADEAEAVAAALAEATTLDGRGEPAAAAAVLRDARLLPAYARDPGLVDAWHRVGLAGRRSGLLGAWKLLETGWPVVYQSAAISRDGTIALTNSHNNEVAVWDLSNGHRRMLGSWDGPTAVTMDPDGQVAVSGHRDGAVRIRDIASGECRAILAGHTAEVTAVCLGPGGRFVVSGSEDRTLRVWDPTTAACLRTLGPHDDEVSAVTLTADGAVAAVGCHDGTIWWWHLPTGRRLRTYAGHTERVTSLCLTADDTALLSASWDGTLRVWGPDDEECLTTIGDSDQHPRSVAVTTDGSFAVVGDEEGNLRVWDLDREECVRVLTGDGGSILALAMTPDGRFVVSCSPEGWEVARGLHRQGNVRVWRMDWDYDFPARADWDDGALPYLQAFLRQHTPYGAPMPDDPEPTAARVERALTRTGRPTWTEADFAALLDVLRYAGYGWLRPPGVRERLVGLAG